MCFLGAKQPCTHIKSHKFLHFTMRKVNAKFFFFYLNFLIKFYSLCVYIYIYIYNLEFLKGLENFVKNTLSFGELLLVLFSNLILSKLFLLSIFFFLKAKTKLVYRKHEK